MGEVRWTGHPFVDAGLAAMAAITDVRRLDELTPEHLSKVMSELKQVLLSDQALGVKREVLYLPYEVNKFA